MLLGLGFACWLRVRAAVRAVDVCKVNTKAYYECAYAKPSCQAKPVGIPSRRERHCYPFTHHSASFSTILAHLITVQTIGQGV